MTDNKDDKSFSYQEIADMANKTKKENQKKNTQSKAAKKTNNVNKRQTKAGDKGHATRKKNSTVKVDRSKVRDIQTLHEFMEWKSLGMNDDICCSYVDINKQTLLNWKKRAVQAIEQCDEDGSYYDDHPDYDYIRFKKMYDAVRKEIIKNGMKAYKALTKDICIYATDEDGDPIYDENGEKIVAKVARPGNVTAIDRMMKIADPEHFDNKQSIDINETKENRVVMITHMGNLPKDENGEVDQKQLESMKNSFLDDLSDQQKGLQEFIENRSKDEE